MKNLTLLALMLPLFAAAQNWHTSFFEIKCWNAVVPLESKETSVFSPVGLVISMAMLGEGTGGTHRANISEALGLLSDFGNAFAYVFKSYAKASVSNQVSITIAPSMWSRSLSVLERDYRRSLQRNFEAETGELTSITPINAWTDVKTDGRIDRVIDAINPRTDVLLLNAIAFEGAWKNAFDESDTKPAEFTCEDGKKCEVAMMHAEAPAGILTNAHFTAVQLPFAAENIHMIYLLPSPGTDIASTRKYISDAAVFNELKQFFRESAGSAAAGRVRLTLPRMESRSDWDMSHTLGIFKVPVAGYSRIGEDFKINEVRQSVYVKIDETGYSLTPGVLPPPPPKRAHADDDDEDEKPQVAVKESVVFNRPFIYFVWDKTSDTLILSGQFTGR